MGTRKKKMHDAASKLKHYYGLETNPEEVYNMQQNAILQGALPNLTGSGVPIVNPIHVKLNDILINTTDGALFTEQIVEEINSLQLSDDVEKDLIRIYYEGDNVNETSSELNESRPLEWRPRIRDLLSDSAENSDVTINPNNPTKENPGISVIMSNSPRVSLEGRNIDPVVIFLNGIPNLEINRAVPFVNLQFYTPRPPTSNDSDGRIQALSLLKFLNGAEIVETGPSSILTKATKVPANKLEPAEIEDPADAYTQAGMELFTSPQTMVDADYVYDETKYATPILDKFRPFLSLNELELSIIGTKGLMSYKSGKIKLTLHDRSRLAQVADFLRAELYGRQQIMIEYGWSHPDGNKLGGTENPYGDLIDGMRVKEKYRIINSSFSFDNAGEVGITLEIAMEGAPAFNTELISSKLGEETPGQVLEQIRKLQEQVEELSKRFNPNQEKIKSKKIHGHQFLQVASDAIHHMNIDAESMKQLNILRSKLRTHSHPDANPLLEKLQELYGEEKRSINGGLIQKYKKTIVQSISEKISALNDKDDPFLTEKVDGARNVIRNRGTKRAVERQLKKDGYVLGKISSGEACSLGKLLLLFVGEPLANTKLYDEVQIITYGFNDFAAHARNKNIAEFAVNLEYFSQELFRYRMEHVSKSGNMNINEFLSFLADTILDDPAAPSYGLFDSDGKFYKEVIDRETGEIKLQNNSQDAATLEKRIEQSLRNQGGKWQSPVIEFYVETLGQEQILEDGIDYDLETGASILRVHIFDKTASKYSTIENLMQSTREGQISAINSSVPGADKGSNPTLKQEKLKMAQSLLEKATESSLGQESLLEKIEDPEDSNSFIYRLTGGSQQLKDFYMNTTPYIIYGAAGSVIKDAQLSSIHDSKLATINLLRSHQKSELEPNGENPGGLPLQVIPTELNLSCFGCPLIDFTQSFFVDFGTGTSADALYRVVGVSHKFTPGEFTTDIKFTPSEGYGQYYSLFDRIGKAIAIIKKDINGEEE